MSDLIERLRDINRNPPILHERQHIADELERLERELAEARGRLKLTERALGFLQRYSPSLHQDLLSEAQRSITETVQEGER